MPDNRVPDGWQLRRLSDIGELGAGNPAPQEVCYFENGTYPFIRTQDVGRAGQSNNFKGSKDRVNQRAVDELGLRLWPEGTTLIPKSGASITLNNRVKLAEPAYASSHLAAIVPKNGTSANFLFQALCLIDVTRIMGNTGYPSLSLADLGSIGVLTPPAEEQRRIAEVLDSIDTAMEKTEAVIEATERLRSALLHELLTRGVPGWHTEWKDVPGIGAIPTCWEVVRFDEVLAAGPDNGLYKPEQDYGSGTWIIRITDFSPGRLKRTSFDRVNASAEETTTYRVCEGDILINRVNSLSHLGKAVLLPRLSEPAIFESNMMRIRLASSILPEYAIKVLCSPATRRYFLARAKKAVAQASVNQTDIRQLVMPMPTREEQSVLVAAVARLDERTTVEAQALTALTTVKSVAAAALLSGQVRVPSAVGEA